MKRETKKIEVFISSDEREFLTEKECLDYENNVLKKIEKIKYFKSFSNPDLTEGRCHEEIILFAVLDDSYYEKLRSLQWLIDNKGRTIDYVQGCSAISNYEIPVEISRKEFEEKHKFNFNSISKIFISKEELDGFPKPIWVK